jgi:cell pole-organizing protein PopZ
MSNAAPQTGEPTMEEILASIRRIISEEEVEATPAAAAPEAAEPAMTADEGDDILELTNIVPEPAPAPRQRPALVQPADDIAFDAEPEPEPEPEPLDDGLVAAAVVDRAASAFDALHRGIAISETKAGGSLEGLVREMMKPLLKQWLDTNLPDLVERVVREEVERVTNRRR